LGLITYFNRDLELDRFKRTAWFASAFRVGDPYIASDQSAVLFL